jgi:hypothetical protein
VDTVLLVNAAATWAMAGFIWFVQLVHYPLFSAVGAGEFTAYEARHTRATAWAVALFMPAEALTAAWLVLETPGGVSPVGVTLGLILVAALWIVTAIWQAPMHGRLSQGYDARLHRRLVSSNWIRTILWTVRGFLVLVILGQAMG